MSSDPLSPAQPATLVESVPRADPLASSDLPAPLAITVPGRRWWQALSLWMAGCGVAGFALALAYTQENPTLMWHAGLLTAGINALIHLGTGQLARRTLTPAERLAARDPFSSIWLPLKITLQVGVLISVFQSYHLIHAMGFMTMAQAVGIVIGLAINIPSGPPQVTELDGVLDD